jgi:KaiC/GvpD/RAD55 family RecA-like ATPase
MNDVVETGVPGLDEVLNGGVPRTETVLVSGAPGAGKSILGTQFLYEGVRSFDEGGVYLSFEERAADVRETAESIGFDEWNDFVDGGDIQVYDKRDLLRDEDAGETVTRILDEIEAGDDGRLVVDSLTMFEMFFDTERDRRTYLLRFIDLLKDAGLTSLLTNEQSGEFPDPDVGLQNYLTDGNIYLSQVPSQSGVNRYCWVPKMRRQNVQSEIFPMEIEQGGIRIYDQDAGFAMMEDWDF